MYLNTAHMKFATWPEDAKDEGRNRVNERSNECGMRGLTRKIKITAATIAEMPSSLAHGWKLHLDEGQDTELKKRPLSDPLPRDVNDPKMTD